MRIQRSTGLYNNSTNQVLAEGLECLVLVRSVLSYILYHSFNIKRLAGYPLKITLCYLFCQENAYFSPLGCSQGVQTKE
jgi:hypothetical protein